MEKVSMLENPTASAADAAPAPIKRYAPPNQRNRSLGRRKSGDRFDWTNTVYGNESEKNEGAPTSRNIHPLGDAGSTAIPVLIPLEGCSRTHASRLLTNRWAAVLHRYHDTSIDLSERPVMHSGSSDTAWRNFRLPHQMISPTNSSGPSSDTQMDFLVELGRAIRNANADN